MNQPNRLETLPERKTVRDALRAAGLSDRQVRALLRDGWRALTSASESEAAELREQLDELSKRLS